MGKFRGQAGFDFGSGEGIKLSRTNVLFCYVWVWSEMWGLKTKDGVLDSRRG